MLTLLMLLKTTYTRIGSIIIVM